MYLSKILLISMIATSLAYSQESNKELLSATRFGDFQKVQNLVKEGVDVNVKNPKNANTALHIAAREGYNKILKFLIKSGSDVNVKNKKGSTPLYLATRANQRRSVKILLANGANASIANSKGQYPIHIAAKNGRLGIIKDLESSGANLEVQDAQGNTPLILAQKFNRTRVSSYLIEKSGQSQSPPVAPVANVNRQPSNQDVNNNSNQRPRKKYKAKSTKSSLTPGLASLGGLIRINLAGGATQINVARLWGGDFQAGIYYSFTNIASLDFMRLGITGGITYAKLGDITTSPSDSTPPTLTLPNRLQASSVDNTITQDIIISYGMIHVMLLYPRHQFIHPYADIGLGYVWSRNRSTSSINNHVDELVFNGFLVEAKGGISFQITKNIALFIEAGYRWAKPEFSIFVQDLAGALVRSGFSFAL